MHVLPSIAVGLRRTLRSPGMVLGLWLAAVLAAIPAAVVMSIALARSIGPSQAHESLREGFDMGWYGEFAAEAKGIETTFRPALAGATAFLDNLEALIDGTLFGGFAGLVGVGVLYGLLWALLLGGALRRFTAPDRRRGMAGFLQDGAEMFPRFVRLALISAPLYGVVFLLHRRLYAAIESATRDVTDEVTVLMLSLAVWFVTALLLAFVHVVFGYAKIITVIEGRRSMLLAALRAGGFVLGHPLRTSGLYFALALAAALLLALYGWLGPGTAQAGWVSVTLAFAVGQLYLLLRTALRLTLLGAETELFLRLTSRRASPPPPAAAASRQVA